MLLEPYDFKLAYLFEFWGTCVLTAAYIINRTPSYILKGKTPYEILFVTKPCYERIKVFGFLCCVHNYQRKKDKFAPSRAKVHIHWISLW